MSPEEIAEAREIIARTYYRMTFEEQRNARRIFDEHARMGWSNALDEVEKLTKELRQLNDFIMKPVFK